MPMTDTEFEDMATRQQFLVVLLEVSIIRRFCCVSLRLQRLLPNRRPVLDMLLAYCVLQLCSTIRSKVSEQTWQWPSCITINQFSTQILILVVRRAPGDVYISNAVKP